MESALKSSTVLMIKGVFERTEHPFSLHVHHMVKCTESLQHYTKMHKVKCTDHSIYGAQAGLQFVLL